MSDFTNRMRDIYITYKDDENPPVPIDLIRDYLKLEGIIIVEAN
ncbi:hypothetical protein [Methanobacterium formicicum]|uniref:Uncharacterized protein n=1 Tax=Methanobacterium formicicum TaxID=2162 RepID=A0A0S4FLX4_METFO|nr:hypothetical protein [Methanobacterium formicicum]CEL23994.1 hypothetical protein MB9_0346 [Methanobacterium formicicum]